MSRDCSNQVPTVVASVVNIRVSGRCAMHRVLFIIVQRYNPNIHCEQSGYKRLTIRYSTQVYTPCRYVLDRAKCQPSRLNSAYSLWWISESLLADYTGACSRAATVPSTTGSRSLLVTGHILSTSGSRSLLVTGIVPSADKSRSLKSKEVEKRK